MPDSRSPARALLLVSDETNRQLLSEWLASDDDVQVTTEKVPSFDICLLDEAALRREEDWLRSHKQTVEPEFLPYLLFTSSPEGDRSVIDTSAGALIDEVIQTPIRKRLLSLRLGMLLRARRLSRQLAESRDRYREIVELTPEPIMLLQDGTIEYANDSAASLLATDRTALLERSFVEFVDTESRPDVARALRTIERRGGCQFVEVLLRTADGEPVPAELAGVEVSDGPTEATQVIVHDLRAHHEREQKLKLFRRAMDEASIGITICDPTLPDNPLVYANKKFAELTGRSIDWLLGRNPRFAQCEDTDDDTVRAIREAIDDEEPISVHILQARADGSRWWNALDISPVRDESGEVTHFLGFQRDVTDRVEREQQLAVLDRVLRHTIRNRLNVILGTAESIAVETDDEQIAERMDTIRSAGESMLSLSEDARRFRDVFDRQEATCVADLAEIARDTGAALRNAYPDVSVAIDCPEEAPVKATRTLWTAVEELLENAVEHNDADDPTVSLTVDVGRQTTALRVADNGSGIPPDERKVLLGEKETPVSHASGLSLWFVRWSVEWTGGSVDYEANDPCGSIVTVRLPNASQA